MNKLNYRVSSRWLLVSLLISLILAGAFSTWLNAEASPAKQVNLAALQDSYTDLNVADTNFNAGLLTAANSPGSLDEGDITTKQIFLQFDLSSVDFEIKTAILSLSTLNCNGLVPVDAVPLAVFGVDNSLAWDESSLTWNNQPALSTGVLATLDAGRTLFNQAQTVTWSDTQQGALATWLETQRHTNHPRATLVVRISAADNPGLGDIFFEDQEGTGSNYGCLDALDGPALELHDTIMYNLMLPLLKR